MTYATWFNKLTSRSPHPWQAALGDEVGCTDRMIRMPTGFGKTAGTVLAWLYNRCIRRDEKWPRRLVFCLPMRVLVEQTEREVNKWVSDAGLDVPVHVLLGGRESARWVEDIDTPAILIGTQDMLLSRALNRGYASARALWPMEFAGLHNDALWVIDEVQLMDVGLATTTQLSAFRLSDTTRPAGLPANTFTWWMSATLQRGWLGSVDFQPQLAELPLSSIASSQRSGALWDVRKALTLRSDLTDPEEVAALAVTEHQATAAGASKPPLTLVVVNTVERASKAFDAARKLTSKRKSGASLHLVHSRFRGEERSQWHFLQRDAECPAAGRIIIATQVVEAGVDISARTLITDLAPWSSLVQRFGRAARYPGEVGTVVVVGGVASKAQDARPYELASVASAADALGRLVAEHADVGPKSLELFEEGLKPEDLQKLYPYEPAYVLRRNEFDDLFDTSPDLSGADLDVGRYIRSGADRDVSIFWRVVEGTPRLLENIPLPARNELCPVPVGELKTFLEKDVRAYVLDYGSGQWKLHRANERVVPGMTVLLTADSGGYHVDRGWSPNEKADVPPVVDATADARRDALLLASLSGDADEVAKSDGGFKTIRLHGFETGQQAVSIAASVGLSQALSRVLELAGRWHDAGKAHDIFQDAVAPAARASAPGGVRRDLAKAPKFNWPPYKSRPGFRHELVSVLMLLEALRRHNPLHAGLLGTHVELMKLCDQEPDAVPSALTISDNALLDELAVLSADELDLLCYVVCAHHGKVRGRWASTRRDIEGDKRDEGERRADGDRNPAIYGVFDGDRVPKVEISNVHGAAVLLPEITVSLAAASLGVGTRYGASWTDRVAQLLTRHGPFTLSLLETLLRVADWRASALPAEEFR